MVLVVFVWHLKPPLANGAGSVCVAPQATLANVAGSVCVAPQASLANGAGSVCVTPQASNDDSNCKLYSRATI